MLIVLFTRCSSQKVFASITRCVQSFRYVDTWAAYISMELSTNDIAAARALYRRGCARRMEEGGQATLSQA